MTIRRLARAACLVVMALAIAAPGSAQPQQEESPDRRAARPYRGLFGPEPPELRRHQEFDLTVSVYEEYASDLNIDADRPVTSAVQQTGQFTALRADLSYVRRSRYAAFGLRSEGFMRYYPDLRAYTKVRHRTDVDLSASFGRRKRTIVRASQSVEYAPYYRLPLLQALSVPVLEATTSFGDHRDDALFLRPARLYETVVSIERVLTPRSSLVFDHNFQFADLQEAGPDVRDIKIAGRYARRLSRYLWLRAGYGYQIGSYGPLSRTGRIESHDIDFGFDYRRPLTPSRRTTLALRTGSSLATRAPDRRYWATGAATLRHEMQMGWLLEAEYSRSLELVQGFAEPFFADTVSVGLGGYLGRRLDVAFSSGYSFGDVGFARQPYEALQGSARARLAVTRNAALETQYLYYHHAFDDRLALVSALDRQIDRYALRVSMTIWLPMAR